MDLIVYVIPVYKKGVQEGYNNNRPISVLSNISKLIKKLVYNRTWRYIAMNRLSESTLQLNQIYNFLNQNKCLYDNPFGFQNHNSTNLRNDKLNRKKAKSIR